MARPAMLTIENWNNCFVMGVLRVSGYVQLRFKMKLLITARENETTLEGIAGSLRALVSKLKTPKSTTEPIVPTIAKRKNFPRSLRLLRKLMRIQPWS